MKHKSIGLSPREMSILRCIRERGLSRKDVAETLGMPQPELTRLVKSLESKGLIVVQKIGMSTSIAFSEMKHASLLRRILNEYSHMRLEEILTLASLRVVTSLAMSPASTRGDVVSSSGVSPRTLQTVLGRLRELGMVRVRARGVYELSDRFSLFADFAHELSEYSNEREAREFSPDSVVVWERGSEFIVRTKSSKKNEDFKMTAFSAFENYGVPLIQEWRYYYHSHGSWRGTPDEVFLQSLLIKPRSSREMTAMKMLWERKGLWRNLDSIRAKARAYGLEDELERIVAYLQDQRKDKEPILSVSRGLEMDHRSDG
jgi:DNA-binding MarR family transcriptional regulator